MGMGTGICIHTQKKPGRIGDLILGTHTYTRRTHLDMHFAWDGHRVRLAFFRF
jgi:hypothetical protein